MPNWISSLLGSDQQNEPLAMNPWNWQRANFPMLEGGRNGNINRYRGQYQRRACEILYWMNLLNPNAILSSFSSSSHQFRIIYSKVKSIRTNRKSGTDFLKIISILSWWCNFYFMFEQSIQFRAQYGRSRAGCRTSLIASYLWREKLHLVISVPVQRFA